ncbi:hypothetical protein QIS74_09460 [Colletotrichum tabaci]|uniref:Uncharacterized protein n=1 Tax=Colletotrichum tabaci TaxID=1209068 RepID=A0AAV9T4V9_9PEZI
MVRHRFHTRRIFRTEFNRNIINRESMASPSPFLSLPREIRDKIYEHYLTVPGGYVCDPDRFAASAMARTEEQPDFSIVGVLKGADGQPIDLNLSYTCRLVASEMHGLALRTNTITFSTVTSDELRILAQCFQSAKVSHVDGYREGMSYYAVQYMPDEVFDELKLKYPPFIPVLERMRSEKEADRFMITDMDRKGPYGEAMSLWSDFLKEVVQYVLPLDPDHKFIRRYWTESGGSFTDDPPEEVARTILRSIDMIECPLTHWAIPADHVMNADELAKGPLSDDVRTKRDRIKYRFSAAAAAVLFLQSLGNGRCAHLRKIVLHEDHESVVHPQRHALGLIPFCQRNPRLFVQRRVDLWKNALQHDSRWNMIPMARYMDKFHLPSDWGIISSDVSHIIHGWVKEALALAPAGMPANSFSLIFDGQPIPHLATQIFQSTLQRDVTWQLAWEESVRRGIIAEPPLFRGEAWSDWYPGYYFRGFPQAMKDIADQKSVVQCNFDVGEPWNVERMVQDHMDWNAQKWAEQMREGHEPKLWETVPPLPTWRTVLEENLVPIPDGPYLPYGDSDSDIDFPSSSDSDSD